MSLFFLGFFLSSGLLFCGIPWYYSEICCCCFSLFLLNIQRCCFASSLVNIPWKWIYPDSVAFCFVGKNTLQCWMVISNLSRNIKTHYSWLQGKSNRNCFGCKTGFYLIYKEMLFAAKVYYCCFSLVVCSNNYSCISYILLCALAGMLELVVWMLEPIRASGEPATQYHHHTYMSGEIKQSLFWTA